MAQDTFLRVLDSADPIPSVREPRAYLTTTARRLLIDRTRREAIERTYLDELARRPQDSASASSEEVLAALQLLARLVRGEALFEVGSDPDRPFVVRTPQGTVRVLGTRFIVSLRPGNTQVTVRNRTCFLHAQGARRRGRGHRRHAAAVARAALRTPSGRGPSPSPHGRACSAWRVLRSCCCRPGIREPPFALHGWPPAWHWPGRSSA